MKTLLILNVALTIPAQALPMLIDNFGPRIVYSCILFFGAIPCFTFAFADNYTVLAVSRFLLGFVGAGFVVGIRLMSDWFPANELGAAEGVYGGWGNFGSAAGAMLLPTIGIILISIFGGDESWRYACAFSGVISMLYSFIFYKMAQHAKRGDYLPKIWGNDRHFKRRFLANDGVQIAHVFGIGIACLELSPNGVSLLSSTAVNMIYIGLAVLYVYEFISSYRANNEVFTSEVPEVHRYQFKQVAILNILYFATFGSELAVVSMLPLFFQETFGLSVVVAGLVASSYAFMNLMSRPGGVFCLINWMQKC